MTRDIITISIVSVSYTHLDVYKRQEQSRHIYVIAGREGLASLLRPICLQHITARAVIDVYKRQDKNVGKIIQVISAVLDIKFSEGNLPEINFRIPSRVSQVRFSPSKFGY